MGRYKAGRWLRLTHPLCAVSADGMGEGAGNEERIMQPRKSLWIKFGRFCSQVGKDERGQDMVEYSLLLAFVCLAGAAAFIGRGQNTTTHLSIAASRLAAANQT